MWYRPFTYTSKKMGKIEISETQFAFAFFHKYLLLNKDEDIIFLFPTLHQEGDPKSDFAGADLVVSNNMFFQFKMTELLKTRNAIEFSRGEIEEMQPPYFRMRIKNSPTSHQFNLLKKAATKEGYTVKYIAPLFNYKVTDSDDDAFNAFFSSTPEESLDYICSIDVKQFIDPRDVSLSPDNTHKICYSRESVLKKNTAYLFSRSKEIEVTKGIKEYNNQSLVFQYNPNINETIDQTIQNVIDIFGIRDRVTNNTSVENVQMTLITEHNIFWLPVIHSKSKRRTRVIRTIISED